MIPTKGNAKPQCDRETLLWYHWFVKCFHLKFTECEQKTLSNPYRSDQCPPFISGVIWNSHTQEDVLFLITVLIFLTEEAGLKHHMKDEKCAADEKKNFTTKLEQRNSLPFIHASTFPSLRTGHVIADKYFDICKQYMRGTSWHPGLRCPSLPGVPGPNIILHAV